MGKQAWAGALAALLAVTLVGAGAQPTPGSTSTALTLTGAGATFPAPLYQRWIIDYREVRPDLSITYDAVGSGEGIARFLAGQVDFGASDAALSDQELARVDPSRGVVMVPMTAGMVVLAYNIPGVREGLVLPRDVYRDIFAGRIQKWDDPRIRAANPGLSLPSRSIITVVRRDSSGTTFAFTNHLGAIDASWSSAGPGVGKLVDWPGNAMTAPGNAGVARRVQLTEGAIGYMEYEFAERLGMPIATLENRAGIPVMPSPASGKAALASAGTIPEDLRLFVPDPEGADAYPIVSYTWLLLNERDPDPAKAEALRGLLIWGLSEGQHVARDLGYLPMPEDMASRSAEALLRIR